MPKSLIILFFFLIPLQAISQVLPKEGSKLNYRLIGFAFPSAPHALNYIIEIAEGYYNNQDSFKANVIRSFGGTENKIVGEAPFWGSQYTWRTVYNFNNKITKTSSLYHFGTQTDDRVDTNKLRLKILQPTLEYKDYFVSVDAGEVLYNMSGNPVWFKPDSNGINGGVADMQFTPQGTITFLFKNAYEINYNGDILWKAPNNGAVSGDTTLGEFYHHEFTRLSNGHYMVLGMQFLSCKSVSLKDSSFIIVSGKRNVPGYSLGRFGTIIEYDEKGNVVWSWKSSKYLLGSDFDYFESGIDSLKRFDPHDNAFYFDEKNKVIYLCFRNLNRITKIEYPSGRVLCHYGENYKPGITGIGSGLFCNPHGVRRSRDGYLYFFNNNSCEIKDSLPSVVMLQEPVLLNESLKKIWEYTCTIDTADYPKGYKKIFGSGGNAIELPDRSIFVNMGTQYSKLFIVNRDKKVLWSALPERFMEPDEKWTIVHEYKANIISREDIERLIWNTEASKHSQ